MMDNDDAEYARRELAYEMGDTPEDIRWQRWADKAASILVAHGFTTPAVGLDGDAAEDGFCLDFAYDAYRVGTSAETYTDELLLFLEYRKDYRRVTAALDKQED